MNKLTRFTIMLLVLILMTSCSSEVITPTSELTVPSEASSACEVLTTLTSDEEGIEYINRAKYELMHDHPTTAIEYALRACKLLEHPEETDVAYVLSEALCVYGIGKTYRAVENSWEVPEDAVMSTSVTLDGVEYTIDADEPSRIISLNLETNEEEITEYDSSVLLLSEENGSIFVFCSDGTVDTLVRGLGTRKNFLVRLDTVTSAYIVEDGYILVDGEGTVIRYSSVRGPVTTVVTHTDSDAVQPANINQGNLPYSIDFDEESNSHVIDTGSGHNISVISENGRAITSIGVSGDYLILSDDTQAIGYIFYKDSLIAAVDKFIAFDPSDRSFYVGADAIINVPIYSLDELIEMAS